MRWSTPVYPILLAMLLLVAFSACQPAAEDAASDSLTDWSRIETPVTLRYQMLDSVQVYGDMTQLVERVTEEGEDRFKITYSVDNGNIASENILRFSAETGNPIGLDATQSMRGMEASTSVKYSDGQVTRVTVNPGAPTADTSVTEVPAGTRDWMQVGFILQSIDMAELDTLRMPFFQGFGQAFVDTATLIHQGSEEVTTPAGTFNTHRVHILYAGAQADFFIEDADQPRVIKHQIPGRQGPLMTVLMPLETEESAEEEG